MPARTKALQRQRAAAPGKSATRPIADPRKRLRKVIQLLEANLGRPVWAGRRDGLQVLVLTILSQNTTDTNSLRAYISLCEMFPDPHGTVKDLAKLPRREDGSIDPVGLRLSQAADAFFSPDWRAVLKCTPENLRAAIRQAGLPNTKQPAIQRVLAWVLERAAGFDLEKALAGLTPLEAVAALSSLKGVGVKTATVTLLEAWGADLCPVDTHVHRIIHRLGVVAGTSDPARTYARLQPLLPKDKGFSLHHNLLTFGRTVCKAKSPACGECFLNRLCPSAGTVG